ncbi:ribosome maturation factor RimP, partial [Saccharopolyspora indica]
RAGEADDDGVTVLVGGDLRRLSYRDVERAVVAVEFQQPPGEDLVKLERAAGGAPQAGDDREDAEESR